MHDDDKPHYLQFGQKARIVYGRDWDEKELNQLINSRKKHEEEHDDEEILEPTNF